MSRRRRLLVIAAAPLALMVPASCGGSEGGDGSDGQASSVATTVEGACQAISDNKSTADMQRALDRYLEDLSAGKFDAELVEDAISRLRSATKGAPARVADPADKLAQDMKGYVDVFLYDGDTSDLSGTAALQTDLDEMDYICPPEDY